MKITDLKPEIVWKFFHQVTQVPRPSKKEGKMIEFLESFAKQYKIAIKKDAVGNILMSKPATPGKENLPTVVLQSHMDMVCEKNNGTAHDFDHDPIETIVDGNWLRANGTTLGADNGIGVAAELAILASDDIEHGPIECLFTVDEETGLTGAKALEKGFMTGDILLNLDSEDEGEIFMGCAGGKDTQAVFHYEPRDTRPIEHGADIVVHSATKFIGGHGSSLGGVIVDSGNFDWKANADKFPTLGKPDPSYHGAVFADVAGPTAFVTRIRAVILRDTGATISPFNAFILLQGLETLSLRVERHVANALKVVEYLSKHPKVTKVNHPALPDHPDHELYKKYFPKGAGSIFTFEIEGGQEAAWKFIDSLEIFSLLANVADVKSLVIHPYTTTHSQMTPEELAGQHITPSTVRLSIGTEYIDDIIDDLDQALTKV